MARRMSSRAGRPRTGPPPRRAGAAAKARSGQPRGGIEKARSGPHRRFQVLAWFFVVTVFCGLALLSGNGLGLGGHARTSATAAASSGSPTASVSTATGSSAGSTTVSSVASDVNGQVLAAPVDAGAGISSSGTCQQYKERRDFLPLNRWTSFGLFTVDNAWIMKVRLFVSMIASLLFMGAGLVWRLIGTLMGFGYTFDMVCWAAPGINTAVHDFSIWAAWFLIPVWLFVLTAVIKRWSGGKNGPASAIRLLMVFLTATGLIFFMGDQSTAHMNDPTAKYTVPWMAATVQGWFGEMSAALPSLEDLGANGASAFYDRDPTTAGNVTCVKLDKALYQKYATDNTNTEMKSSIGGMQQISKIWEVTLVRSWVAAQFGDGTEQYPSPAHAACRELEAGSDVPMHEKLDAYDLSTGNKPGTTRQDMVRGYMIAPQDNEQVIMVAWGACKADGNGRSSDHTIPQWDAASGISGKAKGCNVLYSEGPVKGLTSWWGGVGPTGQMAAGTPGIFTLNVFYFNGKDELNKAFGDCVASSNDETSRKCRADWDFVSGWLGANQAERITQGLLSIVIALVFLFVLGPMAIGLTLASVALAALCMILPLTLILFAAGAEQGKKGLKVTGAMAGAKAVFTLAMMCLTELIDVSYSVVQASVATPTPNFFEQVLEGAVPLAALFLFKKGARLFGLGDISKMTGALGFAGAAALRATGDKDLHRGAAERISQGLGQIGVGNKRLSALDERSLQRRMLNNKATRAVGRKLKSAGKRVAQPVTDWTKDKYNTGRAAVLRKRNDLIRMAKSGSPAQRAAAYAGLAASAAAVTAMAPAATLVSLPLMAVAGAAALGRTTQHAAGRVKNAIRLASLIENGTDDDLEPGSAAGIVIAKNANAAKRRADIHQRNIIRVNDHEERRALTTEYVVDGFNSVRAAQWGANHLDGFNATFKGFTDETERLRALTELSTKTGLASDQILLSNQGLWIPDIVSFDPHTRQRSIAPNATPEALAHPANFLDRHTLQPQMVDGVLENNDQRVARIYAHLRERGMVTDDGEVVSAIGDIRDPAIREQAAAFIAGDRDGELSKVVIKARRSEDAAVRVSREWVQDNMLGRLNRQTYIEADEAMQGARNEISDFNKIRVELPGGKAGTAEEVQVELGQKFDAMKSIVLKTQALHRNKASIDPADYRRRLAELNDLHRARAQDIDDLTEVIRDTVDVSSSARNAWQVWAMANDPATDLEDVNKVKQEIDRLNATRETRQDEWHQELEKLVGGISRMPSSAGSAARMDDVLDDLKNKIKNQVAGEEWDNRVLVDKIQDIERLLEMETLRMATDPRTSSSRHPRIRELLEAMYENHPRAREFADAVYEEMHL
ncbi:hypothetical protein NE236_29750 [Actinoallomurus purpureus]|uniref:hypothetical protein n=1 Tax=Actinoallomurus purpureus TaxID=478114 RepID=UPI002093EB27|nr:hypothetical protein [Actinoallomurus purpureus]MCO6009162.1 hypothetical protein [Actinoallomurus purpureus]